MNPTYDFRDRVAVITGAGPPPTVTFLKNAGSEEGIVSSWGMPTRPTAPPGRATPMAVSIA